jgi:glycosyltransferase involved in cell wall biosynthesis
MSPQIDDLNRLAIIHSSIDLSDISEPKQLSIKGEYTIGYIAAFTEEKDHLLFVEVALKLLQRNSQYRFLLVGDGPLLIQTKKIVSDHADNFEFTGFVEDVDQEYRKMDILLHTAKSEALGTSILDGMRFGLPIVANDVGGINEIVKHGKNGLLAVGRDALQLIDNVSTILCDSELYHQMSAESLALIKPFGVSAMVQKTMDVYLEILRM